MGFVSHIQMCVCGRLTLFIMAVQGKVQELRICVYKLFICSKHADH